MPVRLPPAAAGADLQLLHPAGLYPVRIHIADRVASRKSKPVTLDEYLPHERARSRPAGRDLQLDRRGACPGDHQRQRGRRRGDRGAVLGVVPVSATVPLSSVVLPLSIATEGAAVNVPLRHTTSAAEN